MTNGTLITIEGIDGSGKSTVVDSLTAADFPDSISNVTFTREPTGSPAGKLLREVLSRDDSDPLSELFLFMADHRKHVEETVKPALEDDSLVICDRYIDSRCAYQAHTLEGVLDHPLQFIEDLHKPWSRFPDCTILLDLDPVTAAERTSTGEKYEVPERLADIRENYAELHAKHPDRFEIVDATQSPDVVQDTVLDIIHDEMRPDAVQADS